MNKVSKIKPDILKYFTESSDNKDYIYVCEVWGTSEHIK